jgi:hypothetical protein
MLAREVWKSGLVALGLCLAGAAHADTWRVTSGPNGEQHLTWTFSPTKEGGITGHADVVGGPTNLLVIGTPSDIRVVGLMSHSFCQFAVHESSADKASGVEFCTGSGNQVPWSATIEGD